jgi:EAL domain-containing protein (putative c-di-GMP-specific phosphodiesterase class I)
MVTRDGELVQPGAFIPAAEQFGLMHELDRWVVDGAIELARRGMEVEINLSGASLGDPEIRRRVEAEVADGLAPEMLTFEVTETTAARNIDAARDFAEELERLGCHFALDDFGTGFGSLIYLKHLPFSQLKIDIEFVRELTSSEASRRLVEAIVQMAVPLGLETVAEGVEDGETLALLRELGVDYAQGYFIARPAPVTAPRKGRFRDELPTKTP